MRGQMTADRNATRVPFSLVVITRDAGAQLHACLNSARFADEILIVDSGSVDHTAQVGASFGARIVTQPWLGFGPQKQFAVERAANDWVLCLDADERITPELQAAIETALSKP